MSTCNVSSQAIQKDKHKRQHSRKTNTKPWSIEILDAEKHLLARTTHSVRGVCIKQVVLTWNIRCTCVVCTALTLLAHCPREKSTYLRTPSLPIKRLRYVNQVFDSLAVRICEMTTTFTYKDLGLRSHSQSQHSRQFTCPCWTFNDIHVSFSPLWKRRNSSEGRPTMFWPIVIDRLFACTHWSSFLWNWQTSAYCVCNVVRRCVTHALTHTCQSSLRGFYDKFGWSHFVLCAFHSKQTLL